VNRIRRFGQGIAVAQCKPADAEMAALRTAMAKAAPELGESGNRTVDSLFYKKSAEIRPMRTLVPVFFPERRHMGGFNGNNGHGVHEGFNRRLKRSNSGSAVRLRTQIQRQYTTPKKEDAARAPSSATGIRRDPIRRMPLRMPAWVSISKPA